MLKLKLAGTKVTDLPCGGISVWYRGTQVLRIEDKVMTLQHGGHTSPTIMKRINRFLPKEYLVYQKVPASRSTWHISTPSGETLPFLNGMTFHLTQES